jgi:ribosome-associated toxin RatA of RatAB toxin-antitoxin module
MLNKEIPDMPSVTVESFIPATTGTDLDTVFSTVCDIERAADHSDEVHSVTVSTKQGDTKEAQWTLPFHNGLLCWSQQDWIDRPTKRITFRQLDGDFHHFQGEWTVNDSGQATVVRFSADFDFGIPALAPITDPIAEEVLQASIKSLLRHHLGEDLVFVASTEPTGTETPA